MNAINQIQNGFSLLEVLISVVLFAIGLLGLAALQLNLIKHNHSAYLRAIAISQTNNIVDRMRANYAGVQSGHYSSLSGTPSNPNCTVCTASQIAQRDHHEWNTNNAQLLPSGQGTIVRSGNQHVVTLYWDNDRTGAAGLNCSGNSEVDLTCFIVTVRL